MQVSWGWDWDARQCEFSYTESKQKANKARDILARGLSFIIDASDRTQLLKYQEHFEATESAAE